MREISTYSFKVIQVQRILSDLDIVSTMAQQKNLTTSNQIIDTLQLEQSSHFIGKKQIELNSILNKQQKRLEQLRNSLQIIEQRADRCQI